MKVREITQMSLANDLNIANTTISSWFVGKSKPTVDKLLELKEILHVSLDDLFFKDFTKFLDLSNTKISDGLNEPHAPYGLKEVTIYIEKECAATGGACYFEQLKKANEKITELAEELEKLKKKTK